MKSRLLVACGIALAGHWFAAPASAHDLAVTGTGLLAGLAHPFMGLDHVLAMIAVGLWAAQLGGRARWVLPLAFVAAMAAGGAMAMLSIGLPLVETGVALSVLMLGVALATLARVTLSLSLALVGAFAVFHGQAHATELPHAAQPLHYAFGFVTATALLHAFGLAVGSALLRRHAGILRAGGASIAAAGVGFLLGL